MLQHPKDINDVTCQNITRRADGNVSLVKSLNENIGLIETAGVDFNVTYNTEFDFGFNGNGSSLNVQFRSTFLDKFDTTPIAELPDNVNECAGYFGNTCGTPRPEFQSNTRVNWTTGDLTLSTLIRYIGETEDDQLMVDEDLSHSDLVVPELDSKIYVDLSASYVFSDSLKMNAGIKNVFDEEPQALGDSQQQANTFPELYDVMGPRYFVSATYTFN